MRAARFHGREDVRIDEVDEPSPGPMQVKIANAYAGLCGSDLHVFYDPDTCGLDFGSPHPITGSMPPQILGHEFSGVVVEVGSGVRDVSVGDPVAVWPTYFCGDCPACRAGMTNTCATVGFHGLTSDGGGMAQYTVVEASMVHVLPDGVDLRMGALVEPMAVGWHAVTRSGLQAGDSAAILGAGPIGIGLWLALRSRGIDDVVISEPNENRRRIAAVLGARVVTPVAGSLREHCRTLGDGGGPHAILDAAGVGPAFIEAIDALRAGGRLVVVGNHGRPVGFDPNALLFGELEIVGSLGYRQSDYDEVIAAMSAGRYDTTGWVDEVPLDEVVDAFARLRAGQAMKLLVEIS